MGAEIGDLVGGREVIRFGGMILTCPECATRYFVDDDKVGPEGRPVRCASCGTRWTAHAEEPLELTDAPPPIPDRIRDPGRDDPAGLLPAEELPKVFRARAQTQKKVREAAATGVVWAALAAGFAVVIGVGLLMRQDIAQIWPRAAGAYAMIGLPVNLVGLTIEGQHADPALRDGHAALLVTGALRNIRDQDVAPPPLRISVLNKDGKTVQTKIGDPGGQRIPPGEARHFAISLLDPPVSAAEVSIEFVLDGRKAAKAAQPKPSATAKIALRGPAPPTRALPPPAPLAPGPVVAAPAGAVDAKPLPADSPYALKPAASADDRAPAKPNR